MQLYLAELGLLANVVCYAIAHITKQDSDSSCGICAGRRETSAGPAVVVVWTTKVSAALTHAHMQVSLGMGTSAILTADPAAFPSGSPGTPCEMAFERIVSRWLRSHSCRCNQLHESSHSL